MHLNIKPISKLFACLRGYSQNAYDKLFQTGLKIFRAIEKSESLMSQMGEGQQEHLHSLENTYHVVSKLLLACKDEIKQFYFINKSILQSICQEDERFEN